MKPLRVLIAVISPWWLAGAGPVSGQPVAPPLPPPLQAATGRPWLGLQLSKTETSMSAHIPSLPPGVGFVVKSIDAGGPGEAAKFRLFDVVWKMADQLLINEAQLATLMGLHRPGDEISFTVFRGGKELELTLKLGDLPVGRDTFDQQLAEAAILPGEAGPMRVVNLTDRTATLTTDEGKAVLRKEGAAYVVIISNPDNEVIFQGDVTDKDQLEGLSKNWQRRVCALKRGLDHAMERPMVPVRPPRPRVVPPPSPPQ